MKILLVHDYASPTGGAEIQVLTLRDELRRRGHDARLFAASCGTEADFADYKCLGTTSAFRTLLQTANPSAFWRLRRVLGEFRPDIVHVKMFLTQLSPLILPLLREIPSLYHVVWYRPICLIGTKVLPDGKACRTSPGAVCYNSGCLPLRDWLPLMLQLKLWQRWHGVFNLIVANSDAVKRRLMSEGFKSVEVVWNGVPIQPARSALALRPTVVFAGRLVREKGVDVLLQAFATVVKRVPAAQLLLAGEGPQRERLEKLITELDLRSCVFVLGHLSRQKMEHEFAGAWVQVVPSTWAEPFGLVAVEAMMRGTAVIASDSGGLAEIVKNGATGFLVPPGDIDALAHSMGKILRDRQLAERMGKAGREVALVQFNEATYVDRFLELYQMLARQPEKDASGAKNTAGARADNPTI